MSELYVRLDATGGILSTSSEFPGAPWVAIDSEDPRVAFLKAAPPLSAASLLGYAEAKRARLAAGGISVNIAPVGSPPKMVEVGTGTDGLAMLANAVQLTSTAPGTSFEWDQAEPVTLTGAQVVGIQVAVGMFNQDLFSQKSAARAGIAAGTITTTAQVDALAWPVNS